MKAYSLDLHIKIVESVRKGVSKSETARRFGANRSTVNPWLVECGTRAKRALRFPHNIPVDTTSVAG